MLKKKEVKNNNVGHKRQLTNFEKEQIKDTLQYKESFTMPDIKVSDQKPTTRTMSQDQMYNYFKNLSDEDQRLACSAIKVEFMIERIVGDLHQFDELKSKIKKMQEGF